MTDGGAIEVRLVRHAPVLRDGCAYGRRDIAADLSDASAFTRLATALPDPGLLISSPAARCRDTSQAIWPDLPPRLEPALWEQDLGQWEGLPLADLPDIGTLSTEDLARHRPPGGESFADQCARVGAYLAGLEPSGAPITLVAHAGTIRAALAFALGGNMMSLRFEIATLSITQLAILPSGEAIVRSVNESA